MNTLPTVFAVEPDPAICESIRVMAGVLDLRFEAYATGQDFLDAFDRRRPGCLVLEIRIPGVNGLQIQQNLVDMGATLPLIFLTSSASVSIAVHAMRMGAFHFLEKPFHEHDLWSAVREAIQFDHERREAGSCREAIDAQLGLLSERELAVLELLADGKSKCAMAKELGLSVRTVEHHRTQLMRKLKLETNSIAGLLRFALTMKQHATAQLSKWKILPGRHGDGSGIGAGEFSRYTAYHPSHAPQGPLNDLA